MRLRFLILLALLVACRSPKSQVEPGAALLHVKTLATEPTPDSLVVWVYDNSGVLWNGERIPKQGALTPVSANDLGTVLIQPGPLNGALRIHVTGMQGTNRVSDGVLTIDSLGSGVRTFDLLLSSDAPADSDGDGVPDSIDDCTNLPDPDQTAHGNCSAVVQPDGGADLSPGPDAPSSGDADAEHNGLGDVPNDGVNDGPSGPDAVETKDDLLPPDDLLSRDSRNADLGDTQSALPDAVAPEVADVLGPEIVSRDLPSDLGPDTADVAPDVTDAIVYKDAADAAILCDAAGACGKIQGSACSSDLECSSGHCADGVCCTNACTGLCRSCNQPSSVGVCQGYPMGTDPEGECTGGATCNGAGACGAPPSNLANGQLCTSATQCGSHFCKDGVCCNSACIEACQTCVTGTCTTVKRADDIPECTGAMTCNGAGICVGR